MSGPVFALPALPDAAIAGDQRRYPVRRIFCVGRNYADHAREMGSDPARDPPFYFTKQADTLTPSGAVVPYPPGTANLHHEIELVVALGATAAAVSPAAALASVWGYGCGLDMTRRDLQAQARELRQPWDLAKSFANAAILAPLVPVARCGHPTSGAITLAVNGQRRQHGDLAQMIWTVPEIIADLSRFYRLEAGDLIYTGTPAGVGPVVAGDRIDGAVEGLGTIELTIA